MCITIVLYLFIFLGVTRGCDQGAVQIGCTCRYHRMGVPRLYYCWPTCRHDCRPACRWPACRPACWPACRPARRLARWPACRWPGRCQSLCSRHGGFRCPQPPRRIAHGGPCPTTSCSASRRWPSDIHSCWGILESWQINSSGQSWATVHKESRQTTSWHHLAMLCTWCEDLQGHCHGAERQPADMPTARRPGAVICNICTKLLVFIECN